MLFEKLRKINSLATGTSLSSRIFRSGVVLFSSAMVEKAIRLLRTMILARLLLREDFGLMAFAVGIAATCEALTDAGVRSCIIQSSAGGDPRFLNAAWWIEAGRRGLMFLAIFFAAPIIAGFVGQDALTAIIRIVSLSIFFSGLQSPKVHLLERELRYGNWVLIVQGSHLLGSIITVTLVLIYRSSVMLATGLAIESAIRCLLSFAFCPFRPSARIDRSSLKQVMRFALGNAGTPLMMVLIQQADTFIVGKVLGMSALGGYSIALSLASIPLLVYQTILGRLLVPSYAEKKKDPQGLERFISELMKKTALIGIPLIVLMMSLSKPLLAFLYGAQYSDSSLVFSILCVYVLIRAMSSILASICYAFGQPELDRRSMLLRGTILMLLIYPATAFLGPAGTASTLVLSGGVYLLDHISSSKRFFVKGPLAVSTESAD